MVARLASAADAGVLADLLGTFNAEFDTWSPSRADLERRLARMVAGQSAYAVVAEGRGPEGFALVTLRPSPYYDGPVATLDELYVVPARRGRGVGSELMGVLLERARELRCGEVQINVDEPDVDARRFYERHGFRNHDGDSSQRMLCYVRDSP